MRHAREGGNFKNLIRTPLGEREGASCFSFLLRRREVGEASLSLFSPSFVPSIFRIEKPKKKKKKKGIFVSLDERSPLSLSLSLVVTR